VVVSSTTKRGSLLAGNRTDEPRPRAVPLSWTPFTPNVVRVDILPVPQNPMSRDFLDVLSSRRSAVGGPLDLAKIADLLWYAVGTKGYAPAGRAGVPIEWSAAPSAGALHPISLVCIPHSGQEEILLYDPRTHAFQSLNVDIDLIISKDSQDLLAVTGLARGYTLRFIADTAKVDAAYINSSTLVLRDAGCLVAMICLCAEWLKLSACPLGFLGQNMVAPLGFPEPRFQAIGGVQISSGGASV
jgi:hypothetical protein